MHEVGDGPDRTVERARGSVDGQLHCGRYPETRVATPFGSALRPGRGGECEDRGPGRCEPACCLVANQGLEPRTKGL